MKKLALPLLILFALMFVIDNTLFAQGLFVPTFDGEKTSSLHFGFGEEYQTWTDKSTSEEMDISQKMTVVGINWEHNVKHGFYHVRAGYVIMGDMEIETSLGSFTNDYWSNYQDLGLYFAAGYMYIVTKPMKPDNEKGMNNFFGGGIDASFLLATASSSSYEDTYHHLKLAFLGTIGIRMPDKGFGAYLNLGFNFLASWEIAEKDLSTGVTDYISDYLDATIPIFFMELGAFYQLPTAPKLRFGISIKLISYLLFNLHVGYTF